MTDQADQAGAPLPAENVALVARAGRIAYLTAATGPRAAQGWPSRQPAEFCSDNVTRSGSFKLQI